MLAKPVFCYSSLVLVQTFDQSQNLYDELPYHKDLFKIKTPERFFTRSLLTAWKKIRHYFTI